MNKSDNELIAEFMGLDRGAVGYYHLKYESDWNLLMPVLEKIQRMDFEIEISFGTDSMIRILNVVEPGGEPHTCFTKYSNNQIEVVYGAVVEFIKWYNTQQNG